MKSQVALLSCAVLSAVWIHTATAQSIAKTGTISVHSGWKSIGDMTQVAADHLSGAGHFWGVTFNDSGSGPLHAGAVLCPYSLDVTKGAGPGQRHLCLG